VVVNCDCEIVVVSQLWWSVKIVVVSQLWWPIVVVNCDCEIVVVRLWVASVSAPS
jgi:hypothetical protein